MTIGTWVAFSWSDDVVEVGIGVLLLGSERLPRLLDDDSEGRRGKGANAGGANNGRKSTLVVPVSLPAVVDGRMVFSKSDTVPSSSCGVPEVTIA
jgi:hypothetical protein